MYSRFSGNPEADASDLLEDREEMVLVTCSSKWIMKK